MARTILPDSIPMPPSRERSTRFDPTRGLVAPQNLLTKQQIGTPRVLRDSDNSAKADVALLTLAFLSLAGTAELATPRWRAPRHSHLFRRTDG